MNNEQRPQFTHCVDHLKINDDDEQRTTTNDDDERRTTTNDDERRRTATKSNKDTTATACMHSVTFVRRRLDFCVVILVMDTIPAIVRV